jgi:hypothetical protein
MRIYPVLFFLLILSLPLRAQQSVPVEGTVVDAESGAPISGAVIRAIDLRSRTYTSSGGRFRLPLPAGTHRITASSLGYNDTTISITTGVAAITIRLRPSSIRLQGVEITAGLTADQIVQRAITRKEENIRKAKTVQGLLYSKFALGIEGEAFGQIEESDRQVITETFSRSYFSERGHRLKIIQRRQTANIPANSNLIAIGNFLSFYSDELQILNANVPSPLNPNTLSRYEFSLRERTSLNGQTVYVIDVRSSSRLLPAFEGTIKISSETYNLIEVDLKPSESTAISFVRNLRFEQKFEKFQDDIWQPTYLKVTGNANVEIVQGFAEIDATVTATSIFTELLVNEPIPDSVYAEEEIITAAPTADSARPEFWEGNALSELTPEEKATYERVDSLVIAADTVTSRGGLDFDIAPYLDFNRVGSATLGAEITPRYGPVRLALQGGWSFGLKEPLGRADATVTILPRTDSTAWLQLRGSLFSTLGTTSSDRSYPAIFNTAASALVHRDYYDYYKKDGWGAMLSGGFSDLSASVELESARHFSVSNTTSRSIFIHKPFRPNPIVPEGSFNTIRTSIISGAPDFFVAINSSPRADFNARISALYGEEQHSGMSFRSIEGATRLTVPTIPTGYSPMLLHVGAAAGIGSSNLPIQYQFRMPTSLAFIGKMTSFFSAPVGHYGGTRYATFFAEHDFSDILWRAVGLPTYEGRGIDLSISGAAGYFENASSHGYLPTNGKWYMEAGFGIGRIPIFISNVIYLRFDARWGIGELGARKFGAIIGLSSPF